MIVEAAQTLFSELAPGDAFWLGAVAHMKVDLTYDRDGNSVNACVIESGHLKLVAGTQRILPRPDAKVIL